MCILLKLDYAKFGVSNLFFFSKVIKEKPLGGGGGGLNLQPLVKEGLTVSERKNSSGDWQPPPVPKGLTLL